MARSGSQGRGACRKAAETVRAAADRKGVERHVKTRRAPHGRGACHRNFAPLPLALHPCDPLSAFAARFVSIRLASRPFGPPLPLQAAPHILGRFPTFAVCSTPLWLLLRPRRPLRTPATNCSPLRTAERHCDPLRTHRTRCTFLRPRAGLRRFTHCSPRHALTKPSLMNPKILKPRIIYAQIGLWSVSG